MIPHIALHSLVQDSIRQHMQAAFYPDNEPRWGRCYEPANLHDQLRDANHWINRYPLGSHHLHLHGLPAGSLHRFRHGTPTYPTLRINGTIDLCRYLHGIRGAYRESHQPVDFTPHLPVRVPCQEKRSPKTMPRLRFHPIHFYAGRRKLPMRTTNIQRRLLAEAVPTRTICKCSSPLLDIP